MPKNKLTIGYTENGEVQEHTTTVEAWRDLENATIEVQLRLLRGALGKPSWMVSDQDLRDILDLSPWVISREIVPESYGPNYVTDKSL